MTARILIIEDNVANLELMTYLLQAFGHTTFTAMTGEDGLAVARRERPDLIVCDIQLPGLDGYEVARRAKADPALRDVPIVAVTALAMVGDRDRVLAAGFNGYLSKPIEPEKLMPQLADYLAAPLRTTRPAPEASSAAGTAPAAHGPSLLVVDDRPVNLSLLASILAPSGYSLRAAESMREALVLARQAPPDLIVSDLQMADGTGFDFIAAVKADDALRGIPFVFLTSTYCDEASRARGLALGAARFLFRPVEPQVLLDEIRSCLPHRSEPNHHGHHPHR